MNRRAGAGWLAVVQRYLLLVAAGNPAWEILQLPGFADWRDDWSRLAFIVVIGTAGGKCDAEVHSGFL
jgi:hypothetical protein